MAGIKLNQNIKIMDRKVLKDKIDELRSTAKMELACTIREIMREHKVNRKVFDWPIDAGNGKEVNVVEVHDCDTAIPIIYMRCDSIGFEFPETKATDDCIPVDLLAEIATGLNNELNGYIHVYAAKYKVTYDDGTSILREQPYVFQAESYKDALNEAEDYKRTWNSYKYSTLEIVSVEKQTASEG